MDDRCNQVWRALADQTRRGLLDLLSEGPRTTGDLAECVPGLSRFAVMKHLRVLEQSGLITVQREGRNRLNHLNAVPLRMIYERWVSRYEHLWAGSLLGLKDVTEQQILKAEKMETIESNAFAVTASIEIATSPAAVFDAWFDECGVWFAGAGGPDAVQTAVMEKHVGGRFYFENIAGPKKGKVNLLAQVTMIEPGRKLRLRGDFTLPQALVANCTVTFENHGAGCQVTVEHRMFGECTAADAEGFRDGWLEGLQALKKMVEGAGNP